MTDDDDRLADVLLDWQERRDRGDPVDPEDLIRAHPDLAGRLRVRFAALAAVDEIFAEAGAEERPPERIGPYRIVRTIGRGGMGTVYLASDEAGQSVALKVIQPHLLSRPGFFKRFLREAEAGKHVRHENVVRTLDADALEVGGRTVHFLVMEYVEGQTLAGLREQLGTVPEGLLREIARQMTAGLTAIHAAGIVHRDLKPENALITGDHVVRIMDLGVARLVESSVVLTSDGQFAGTLPYVAPEQFRGGEVGPAADLYSLGVVLHEMATGANPFRRDEPAAVMRAHLETVPPSAREVVPDLSAFLSEVIATLLAKEPGNRFESAAALAEVLAGGERSTWWREREAHRPRAPRLPQVPVRRETALHGRVEDLALLRRAWDAAAGGSGRTVLLEGEAGIGKSRLVDAFLADAAKSGDVRVLYGSYPPTGGLGGISDAILEHFGRNGLEDALRPWLTVTPALVPAFAALVRREAPPEGVGALTPDAVHAVLVHLMRALAAEKPLVWVVEDLHFADAESRGYVLSLARAVEGHRVLVLATTRPGVPEDWLAHFSRLAKFERHLLGRLSAREVILLLQDAFKSEHLADKLGARIALKSDGIPFFVFEMIRGLREGQFITELPDGSWVETRVIDRIEVPSAVRGLIEARLRDLPEERRALLDVGAVQGFEFRSDVAAEVLDRPRLAVLRDLAAIERRSGVIRAEGDVYRFDHHHLQEVLYGSMPAELRRAYHAALGDALERRTGAADRDPEAVEGATCVALAGHLLAGEQAGRALRYLDAAFAHLAASHEWDQASGLAERALAAPGALEGRRRLDVLLRRADALQIVGRGSDERAALDEAVGTARAAGAPTDAARALAALGGHLAREWLLDEALTVLTDALREAAAARDRPLEIGIVCRIADVLKAQHRLGEARSKYEAVLSFALESGDLRLEGRARGGLGIVAQEAGRGAASRPHHERQLACYEALGDERGVADALGDLGMLLSDLDRCDEARLLLERQLALAREIGDRRGEGRVSTNFGNLLRRQGRVEEAMAYYRRQIEISREIDNPHGEANAHGNLGAALWELGRLLEAQECFDVHLRLARERGVRGSELFPHLMLGLLHGRLGDRPGALRLLSRAEELAREAGKAYWTGVALEHQSDVEESSANDEDALRLAEQAHAVFLDTGPPGKLAPSFLRLGRIQLALGRLEEAQTALREASSRARACGSSDAMACAYLALASTRDEPPRLDPAGECGQPLAESMELRYVLWRATGDPGHLAQARCHLDFLVAHAPPDCRESMLANVRLHREIAGAARERGA